MCRAADGSSSRATRRAPPTALHTPLQLLGDSNAQPDSRSARTASHRAYSCRDWHPTWSSVYRWKAADACPGWALCSAHEPRIRPRERWWRRRPEDLPERPVSTHPNFVTARGLQLIERRIHELEAAREAPKRSETRLRSAASIAICGTGSNAKRLRSSSSRDGAGQGTIRCARDVALRRRHARSFTLVGEDEADPARVSSAGSHRSRRR